VEGGVLFCRSVRSLVTAQDAHDRLQKELAGEKASALQRIGSRLEELILETSRRRESLIRAAGPDTEQRTRAHAALKRVRAEALRHRWYLEVQREALGIRNHRRLDEFYPVPPPLDP